MGGDKDEAARRKDWEIPAPSAPSRDPWAAPGQWMPSPLFTPSNPLSCRLCGLRLLAREAFAHDGEMYCGACKPPGAISGARDLPPDDPIARTAAENPLELLRGPRPLGRLLEWLSWLWR